MRRCYIPFLSYIPAKKLIAVSSDLNNILKIDNGGKKANHEELKYFLRTEIMPILLATTVDRGVPHTDILRRAMNTVIRDASFAASILRANPNGSFVKTLVHCILSDSERIRFIRKMTSSQASRVIVHLIHIGVRDPAVFAVLCTRLEWIGLREIARALLAMTEVLMIKEASSFVFSLYLGEVWEMTLSESSQILREVYSITQQENYGADDNSWMNVLENMLPSKRLFFADYQLKGPVFDAVLVLSSLSRTFRGLNVKTSHETESFKLIEIDNNDSASQGSVLISDGVRELLGNLMGFIISNIHYLSLHNWVSILRSLFLLPSGYLLIPVSRTYNFIEPFLRKEGLLNSKGEINGYALCAVLLKRCSTILSQFIKKVSESQFPNKSTTISLESSPTISQSNLGNHSRSHYTNSSHDNNLSMAKIKTMILRYISDLGFVMVGVSLKSESRHISPSESLKLMDLLVGHSEQVSISFFYHVLRILKHFNNLPETEPIINRTVDKLGLFFGYILKEARQICLSQNNKKDSLRKLLEKNELSFTILSQIGANLDQTHHFYSIPFVNILFTIFYAYYGCPFRLEANQRSDFFIGLRISLNLLSNHLFREERDDKNIVHEENTSDGNFSLISNPGDLKLNLEILLGLLQGCIASRQGMHTFKMSTVIIHSLLTNTEFFPISSASSNYGQKALLAFDPSTTRTFIFKLSQARIPFTNEFLDAVFIGKAPCSKSAISIRMSNSDIRTLHIPILSSLFIKYSAEIFHDIISAVNVILLETASRSSNTQNISFYDKKESLEFNLENISKNSSLNEKREVTFSFDGRSFFSENVLWDIVIKRTMLPFLISWTLYPQKYIDDIRFKRVQQGQDDPFKALHGYQDSNGNKFFTLNETSLIIQSLGFIPLCWTSITELILSFLNIEVSNIPLTSISYFAGILPDLMCLLQKAAWLTYNQCHLFPSSVWQSNSSSNEILSVKNERNRPPHSESTFDLPSDHPSHIPKVTFTVHGPLHFLTMAARIEYLILACYEKFISFRNLGNPLTSVDSVLTEKLQLLENSAKNWTSWIEDVPIHEEYSVTISSVLNYLLEPKQSNFAIPKSQNNSGSSVVRSKFKYLSKRALQDLRLMVSPSIAMGLVEGPVTRCIHQIFISTLNDKYLAISQEESATANKNYK